MLSQISPKIILYITRDLKKILTQLLKKLRRFPTRFIGSDPENFNDTMIKIYPRTDLVVYIGDCQVFYSSQCFFFFFFWGSPVYHFLLILVNILEASAIIGISLSLRIIISLKTKFQTTILILPYSIYGTHSLSYLALKNKSNTNIHLVLVSERNEHGYWKLRLLDAMIYNCKHEAGFWIVASKKNVCKGTSGRQEWFEMQARRQEMDCAGSHGACLVFLW